jgi:hypothetical protein
MLCSKFEQVDFSKNRGFLAGTIYLPEVPAQVDHDEAARIVGDIPAKND